MGRKIKESCRKPELGRQSNPHPLPSTHRYSAFILQHSPDVQRADTVVQPANRRKAAGRKVVETFRTEMRRSALSLVRPAPWFPQFVLLICSSHVPGLL